MTPTPELRAAVVAEAMRWVGTPYHHHARVMGAGVDCAQLPIAVYGACGYVPPMRPRYAAQWHLHRSEELYQQEVRRWARGIQQEEAGAGDFVLWRFGRTMSHGGIMIDERRVVHAWVNLGVTIDDIEQHSDLCSRERQFYTVWGQRDGR